MQREMQSVRHTMADAMPTPIVRERHPSRASQGHPCPRRLKVQNHHSSKQIKNALHVALEANDKAAAKALIETGDATLLNAQVSNSGPTPLMLLAMGCCTPRPSVALAEPLIWLLLKNGGGASIAAKSKTRRTAVDYAQAIGSCSAELMEHLRSLEAAERERTSDERCVLCGNPLQHRSSPLALAARRAAQGDEPNPLLQSFFAADRHLPFLEPALHAIHNLKPVRKELSESLSVLEALEALLNSPQPQIVEHVVDLACGRGVTATLAALRYPAARVSALDILEPALMPHWDAMGSRSCRPVRYVKHDMLSPGFVELIDGLCAEGLPAEGLPRPSEVPARKPLKADPLAAAAPAAEVECVAASDQALADEEELADAAQADAAQVDRTQATPLSPSPSSIASVSDLALENAVPVPGTGTSTCTGTSVSDSTCDEATADSSEAPAPSEATAHASEATASSVLLGMHLCGELSVRAIAAFARCERVHTLVLSPCCLPKQGGGVAPDSVYASKLADEQYAAWADHLEAQLRQGGHAVARSEARWMMSEKNLVLTAVKQRAAEKYAAPQRSSANEAAAAASCPGEPEPSQCAPCVV